MEQVPDGDAGGQAEDKKVQHVECGDAVRRTAGEATFVEKKACVFRAPELELDEARQGRPERGANDRADRAGQAGGDGTGR